MSRNLWLTLAALALAAGLGLGWIFRANTDLPPGNPATLQARFEAAAQRGRTPYDARVLHTESLGVQLVSFGIILGLIGRELRTRKFAILTAGTLICMVLSPWGPRPLALTSGLSITIRSLTRTLTLDAVSAELSFWPSVARLLPWGYAGVVWLLIVSIPAASLSLSTTEDDGGRFDRNRILSFLALVAVAGLLMLGAFSAAATTGSELIFAAVMLNAAILLAKLRRPIWSALWLLVVLIPLLDPVVGPRPPLTGPPIDSADTAELRKKIAAGELFANPAIQQVLPESIRPPIKIEAAETKGPAVSAFTKNSAPALPGRDGRPAWGNWSPAGAPYATGEFVSTPFGAPSGIIQIRVAGTLQSPAAEINLRRAGDGRLFHPLTATVSAPTRWRRINFEVKPGEYQLVATVHSSTTWLAFTAPEAIYFGARFANKLVQTWAWWAGAGLLILLGVATVAYRSQPFANSSAAARSRWGAAQARFAAVCSFPVVPPALIRAAPWLLLVGYALQVSHHIDSTAGPNDSGGYLNSAKLLAAHHTTALPRLPLPGQKPASLAPYLPGTFVATPDGRLAPTYPVGFPLIVAAAAQALPLGAAVPMVILIQICLGVALTYWLAREFDLSPGWATLAAAIVGLSPVYLFQALQPQSDGPALVWVTGAIYLAWTSARHPWRAFAAGLATAVAVLIRPSNALAIVPLVIVLAGRWREITFWILGGIPGAIFQFWYNEQLYGHGLSTGYGDASEVSAGFGLRFAPLTVSAYLHWLPAFFTPLIGLALVGPWLPSLPLRLRLALGAWAAVFLLFYTFYWCTYDNWYNMRFILPAAPALVILALWAARWLCSLRPIPLLLRGAAALVLLALLVQRSAHERIFFWTQANRVNADAALWARDHLPAGAVVIGKHITGPLFYYSNLAMVRTDSAPAQSPEFYAELAKAGHPVYALIFHWEQRGFHWGHGKGDGYPDAPGSWEHLATIGDDEVQAWRLRAPPPLP